MIKENLQKTSSTPNDIVYDLFPYNPHGIKQSGHNKIIGDQMLLYIFFVNDEAGSKV